MSERGSEDHGTYPAQYEIGRDGPDTLVISVHRLAIRSTEDLAADAKLPRRHTMFRHYHGLSAPFIPPSQPRWGFGPVLERQESTDQWIRWSAKLPQIHVPRKRSDQSRDHWKRGVALSVTLQELFHHLLVPTADAGERDRPQLMRFDQLCEPTGCDGKSVIVTILDPLSAWLASQSASKVQRYVTRAINETDAVLWPEPERMDQLCVKTQVRVGESWSYLTIDLGSVEAANLDRWDTINPDSSRQRQLVSMNITNARLQLDLLMGLAALHDLARQPQSVPAS